MNISNKAFDTSHFSSHSPRKLAHFFKNPETQKPLHIFEMLGIHYKWEGTRAILASDNANSEVDNLENHILSQNNTTVHTQSRVQKITSKPNGFDIHYQTQRIQSNIHADIVFFAPGGKLQIGQNASPSYDILTNLGHSITDIKPSLTPLILPKHPLKHLTGLTFQGTIYSNKHSSNGNILITHKGLSGPAVLDFTQNFENQDIRISFLSPEKSAHIYDKIKQARNTKHNLESFFETLLPKRLATALCELSQIPPKTPLSQISKAQEQHIIHILINFPLHAKIPGTYQSAWTSYGGIPLDELHVHSLESKQHPGLYFG